MAKCEFCGEEAGLLKKHHKECKAKFESGQAQIRALAIEAAVGKREPKELEKQMAELAKGSFIADTRPLLVSAFENAVESSLEDDLIDKDEESSLAKYKEYFKLGQNELDENKAFTRLVQASVIRDLTEDKVPDRIKIEGTLPFNFQKTEKLVYVFNGVSYFESRSKTSYSGGYSGMSVRVAKGLYYKTGSFRGNPIVTSQTVKVDSGYLGFTTKHVYFAGSSKSFRIPYVKIVSFAPYNDGIGLQKDGANAKPQSFGNLDGWFVYNLATNLSRLA
jgi:hypothetical protein